jgi:tripartite-type tricarboxylate transporter receptor subunit TctC
VKAPPDGYTLLMIGSNNAWNVTLYDNLSFNFIRDIAPVASIYRGPAVLVVHRRFSCRSTCDGMPLVCTISAARCGSPGPRW